MFIGIDQRDSSSLTILSTTNPLDKLPSWKFALPTPRLKLQQQLEHEIQCHHRSHAIGKRSVPGPATPDSRGLRSAVFGVRACEHPKLPWKLGKPSSLEDSSCDDEVGFEGQWWGWGRHSQPPRDNLG